MLRNLRNNVAAASLIAVACLDGAWAQAEPPCPTMTPSGAPLGPLVFGAPPLLDLKRASNMSPFVVKGQSAPEETSTVWIETKGGNSPSTYLCTGTLIGANRILTAAHCVCAACKMTVGFGPDLRSPTDKIMTNVDSVFLHPLYRRTGPQMQRGFDLAVLSIENYASCPAYKKPIPVYSVAAAVSVSEFLVVGYGQTEFMNVFGEKKKAPVFMGSVTCTQPWAARAGCVSFREFVLKSFAETILGSELGPDTCNGDSGGPAYVIGEGNTRLLAGVTSRALIPKGGFHNEGCGFGGIYEYAGIPEVVNWLRSVVPDLQVATK